jgi:type I restriction enzyme S subunit
MMGREHWVDIPIEDLILKIESGSRPKGGVKGITKGIPSIGAEHLANDGGFDFSNIRFIPEAFAKRMNRGIIEKDDILIVKDGATTGKVSYVSGSFPFDFACINEHVFKCRINLNISSKYIYYFLKSQIGQEMIMSAFHGGAQGGINSKFIDKVTIPIPPFEEQNRIVAKLDAILPKVKNAKARLERIPLILKKFRQGVLAAACSGKLTEGWREEETRRQGEEVREWEEVLSGKLFSYVTSGSRGWAKYYSETGKLFLRIGNLDHLTIDIDISKKKFVNPPLNSEGTRTKVQLNDILISITADVGMIGLVPENLEEAYINQHIALARPNSLTYPPYLAWYLTSHEGQNQFQELQRGATKLGLGLNDLNNLIVPLPPLEEQHEIVLRVEQLFALAEKIEARYKKALARLEKIEQSVLAKAFRGELAEANPEDEPAEALLGRILGSRVAGKQGGRSSVKV